MTKAIKTVRASHINAALKTLNEKRGFAYPEVGYCYYADIKGNGRNIKSLYTIINANGGVTRSHLNGYTMRETLGNIERAIETARAQ